MGCNVKKEIMVFINTLSGGGAERSLVNLINAMDNGKYDFTVITMEGGDFIDKLPNWVKVYQIANLRNRFLNNLYIKVLHNIPYSIAAKICIRGRYDIEIAYLEGFPTRIIAARKSGAKKIAFVHATVKSGDESMVLYRNTKQCFAEYSRFDEVCFVSQDAKKAMEKCIGILQNASVVHNVFDIYHIKECSKEQCEISYKTAGLKIIAVGSYKWVKGFDRLLHIVKRLESEYEFELWIIGKGPLKEEYETIIRSDKIKSVKLLDFDKNPYKYIAQADLLVCSSHSEAYSTVAVEALILGVPVLTTNCSGMAEILDDGKYGLIVDNDEESLYKGFKKILSEKELYINKKNNALSFKEIFSNDTAIEEYSKILD